MTAEPWTKEQFEDHWYAWAEGRALGVAVPCDCEEEHCHGWRMIVSYLPTPFTPFKEGDNGVLLLSTPLDVTLRGGKPYEFSWTVEIP